jgi:hypothetical protein
LALPVAAFSPAGFEPAFFSPPLVSGFASDVDPGDDSEDAGSALERLSVA